jgi:hypothetical protein
MSRKLAEAQARLVADLRDGRVPDGFDAKGVHATAAVLERKQRKIARRTGGGVLVVRPFWAFLRAWLRNDP